MRSEPAGTRGSWTGPLFYEHKSLHSLALPACHINDDRAAMIVDWLIYVSLSSRAVQQPFSSSTMCGPQHNCQLKETQQEENSAALRMSRTMGHNQLYLQTRGSRQIISALDSKSIAQSQWHKGFFPSQRRIQNQEISGNTHLLTEPAKTIFLSRDGIICSSV